jgi:hypothetical protein
MVSSNVIRRELAGSASGAVVYSQLFWDAAGLLADGTWVPTEGFWFWRLERSAGTVGQIFRRRDRSSTVVGKPAQQRLRPFADRLLNFSARAERTGSHLGRRFLST